MIPPATQYAIDHYVESHQVLGGFIHAVLANDLERAALLADKDNAPALAEIALYCRNEIPAACWGSPAIVDKWLRMDPEPQESVT